MIEYLDWVDNNNKIIGRTTKEESHRLGYPHRVVAIFIFNQKDELLINLRADSRLWDHSVGGHVRQDEDNLTAAKRECREEVGLLDARKFFYIGELFLKEHLKGNLVSHWFSIYRSDVTDEFKPRCQMGEVLELKWIKIQDLLNEIIDRKEIFDLGFVETLNFYLKNYR